MELYDFFNILDNLITIYQANVNDNFSGLNKIVGHLDKPSNVPAFVKNMTNFMEKAKADISGFKGFLAKLFGISTSEYKSMMGSGIKILKVT